MYIIVPTHNEETVFSLLPIIIKNKNNDDTIIVFDDYSEQDFIDRLRKFCDENGIIIHQHKLANDFAAHWNQVHTFVPANEWLVWIAADEIIDPEFFSSLKNQLNANPTIEKFLLPRINTYYDEAVEGFKMPVIDWNGNLHEIGFRYPDYQARIYRHLPHIFWHGKVHETVIGNRSEMALIGKAFTILHHRSRQKVEKSDVLYKAIGHPAYGN